MPKQAKFSCRGMGVNDPSLTLIRYEDLVGNEFTVFRKIIDHCQINVDPDLFHAVVKHNIFEAVTQRERGQEDIFSHQRKGIVGDWQNYFTPSLKKEFKQRFGHVLITTGYEKDLNW